MNASELRLKARESLVGNYWPSVLAALIAAFFGALIATGGSVDLNVEQDMPAFFSEMPRLTLWLIAVVIGSVGSVSLLHFILGGVIQLGYAQYLLKQQDREIGNVKELFAQFDRFGQGFLQLFLRNLYTFLWALLFVIPGIIKSLSYAMTPFIMAENPAMTAKEAIDLSRERMEGHKWELFCLSLSFIGWNLLSALTLGIGSVFLNPYMNAAYAAFYRDKIAPKVVPVAYVYNEPPVLE